MAASGECLRTLLVLDSAGPLAQQVREAGRGRLFRDVPSGRRIRCGCDTILHRHGRQRHRLREQYPPAAEAWWLMD